MQLDDFPSRSFDKLRYGDTDRQGHVNNAVFSTLFETGRVGIFHDSETRLLEPGFSFVLARIAIDFKAELLWPGRIEIGTGVKLIGNRSVTFAQALFQNGKLAAAAESVVVRIDAATRRPASLSAPVKARLAALLMSYPKPL